MSTYGDKLRSDKKAELASKVSLTLANEIWEMSWMVESAEEFVDYLMTVTDQEAIEEFFNQCHDQNGRFCGGGTASRGVPGKNRGPGTGRPAPVDYFKQRIRTKLEVYKQRKVSPAIRKVTVGPALGGITTASYGNVKIKKLAKTNLKDFSTKDLGVLRNRLQADQRFYNSFVLRTAAYKSIVGIGLSAGVAVWKNKNIPPQFTRVDNEIKNRGGVGASIEDAIEFQDDGLMAAGEQEFTQVPEAIIELIAEFLARLEEDEDVSPEDKEKILSSFE